MPTSSESLSNGNDQRHFRQQLETATCEADYTPVIVTRIVTRAKALIHELLPLPVDLGQLISWTPEFCSLTSTVIVPADLMCFTRIR